MRGEGGTVVQTRQSRPFLLGGDMKKIEQTRRAKLLQESRRLIKRGRAVVAESKEARKELRKVIEKVRADRR